MEEVKKKIVDEFKYLNDCDDDEFFESDNCEDNDNSFLQDEFEIHIIESAFTIRNNLFDYVKSYGLPLCEKLDIDSLKKFIEKVY
jgi:hypothetical protein